MQYDKKGGHKSKAGSETSVAGLFHLSTGCACLICGCPRWFLINVSLIHNE